MNHALVVTSISEPTPILCALSDGAKKADWPFYLIGDEKSDYCKWRPAEYFYSIGVQRATGLKSASVLPLNNYSRKNIGYLLAMRDGAEVIVETDDDNKPFPQFWQDAQRIHHGYATDASSFGEPIWVNMSRVFYNDLWPRGFPLDLVKSSAAPPDREGRFDCPIQQKLISHDPDMDAIGRMVSRPVGYDYAGHGAHVQGVNSWCPFNSQNTTWFKEAFPLMYLPSFCKDAYRMDDIWRSFIAQRIAFENGWSILWGGVTVRQERNPHDLMEDFKQEIPGYLYNRKIVERLKALPIRPGESLEVLRENMATCYLMMIGDGYIEEREIPCFDAWFDDLKTVSA